MELTTAGETRQGIAGCLQMGWGVTEIDAGRIFGRMCIVWA